MCLNMKLSLVVIKVFKNILTAVFFCLGVGTHMLQAEVIGKYSPIFVDASNPSVFFLIGDIDDRVSLNFERAIDQFGTPSVIVLSSNGGLVNQALVVASRVNNLHINTMIAKDSVCFSACSFIFLAGAAKVADGSLGVHQISAVESDLIAGQVAISDIIDILGQFDVPNELIVNMLRTPPNDMYVLSDEEKYKYGYFLRTEEQRDTSTPQSLEQRSAKIMLDYNDFWSRDNGEALPKISVLFAKSVSFYGREMSRSDVMIEKSKFAKRWPIRSYTVDSSTLSSSCISATCNVTAVVQWSAKSDERQAQSEGRARLSIEVLFEGDSFKIISEDGEVLKRN